MSVAIDVGDMALGFSLEGTLGRVNLFEIIDARWAVLITFTHAFEPVSVSEHYL